MSVSRARRRAGSVSGPLPIRLAPALSLLLALLVQVGAVSAEENSCENCHRNPDFLVTNKKLYDYYQEWSASVHRHEGVTCDDCHGGNPEASDEREAHGDGVAASNPASGVYYRNIPETCGTCHDEVLDGFLTSKHFAHLEKKEGDEQGPTCVTCHGSINSEVLDVTSVATACERCHNEQHANHPEIPEKARAILNRFLSIQRFYRYIAIRAEPSEARKFFEEIDPRRRQLAVTWHTFDLEKIDEGSAELLDQLKAKREQIRRRRAEAK